MNNKVKIKFVFALLLFWFSAVAINFVELNPPVVNFVSGAFLAASLWFIMMGIDNLVRSKACRAVAHEDTSLLATGDQPTGDTGNDSVPVSIEGLRLHRDSPLFVKKAVRWHTVDGRRYVVRDVFPNTPDGLETLYKHLLENPTLSVLDKTEWDEWLVVDIQARGFPVEPNTP